MPAWTMLRRGAVDNKVPAIPVGWSLVGHHAGACLITRPFKRGFPTPADHWCLLGRQSLVGVVVARKANAAARAMWRAPAAPAR